MKPFGAKSAVPFVLAAVLGLCACGNTAPNESAVSSLNIEKGLAEILSVTDSNKYLLEDSLQDVYKKEEKDGVSLEVLQVISYENMVCFLAEAAFDESVLKADGNIPENITFDFSPENRTFMTCGGSWENVGYDKEKNAYTYYCIKVFDKPQLEEGMVLNVSLQEGSRWDEDYPPEALDEEGQTREAYEPESTFQNSEEPLTVSWKLEKLGKTVEADIESGHVLNGKIALTSFYVRVWADGSDYGPSFYTDTWTEEGREPLFYEPYFLYAFLRSVRLKHNDGYYIDPFKTNAPELNNLSNETGSFDVLRTFFVPLDPDAVDSVEIMGVNYDLKSKE